MDAFDVSPSERCVPVADWTLLDSDRGSLLFAGRGSFTFFARTRASDGAIVAAMTDAVCQVAYRLERPRTAALSDWLTTRALTVAGSLQKSTEGSEAFDA